MAQIEISENYYVGGLNSDTAIIEMPQGDYPDATNCVTNPEQLNSGALYNNVKNTKLLSNIPTLATRTKSVFINVISTGIVATSVPCTASILGTNYNFSISVTGGDNYSSIMAKFLTALNLISISGSANRFQETDFNSYGYTGGYFESNSVLDLGDFTITFNGAGVSWIQFLTYRSYIDSNHAGCLIPIGSFEVDNVTYIFSALRDYTGSGSTGQIGALQNDKLTNTSTYVPLITDPNFLFSRDFLLKITGKPNGQLHQLYWNDYNNTDRTFSYNYTNGFTTDGAIVFNGGGYSYDSLQDQIRLEISSGKADMVVNAQNDTGGVLPTGGYYYFFRLLNASLDASTWSSPTNLLPVNKSLSIDPAYTIGGSVPSTITSHSNVLQVNNIDTNQFTYIEIGVVYAVSGTFSAYKLPRITITNSTQLITHTGSESITSLTLDELAVAPSQGIYCSGQITIIDNRLVRGDLRFIDSQLFVNALSSCMATTIRTNALGKYGNYTDGYLAKEYTLATNTTFYASLMANETYAWGVRFKLKNGGFTQVYFGGTLKVTPSTYDLTDNIGNAYAYGINIDGVDVTSITRYIDGFEFCLSVVDTPEVITTGYVMLLANYNYTGYPPTQKYPSMTALSDGSVIYPPQIGTGPNIPIIYRKGGCFFSPEYMLQGKQLNYVAGDIIRVYAVARQSSKVIDPNTSQQNFFADFDGYQSGISSYTDYVIKDAKNLVHSLPPYSSGLQGQGVTTILDDTNTPFSVYDQIQGFTGFSNDYIEDCLVFSTSANITGLNPNSYTDRYWYYAQYIRPRAVRYTNLSGIQWRSVGKFVVVNVGDNVINGSQFYGGDTFIQKSYVRLSDAYVYTPPNAAYSQGIGGYTQNRINMQNRYASPTDYAVGTTPKPIFPFYTPTVTSGAIYDILKNWLVYQTNQAGISFENRHYDTSQTPTTIQALAGYNPKLVQNNIYRSRICWSNGQTANGQTDGFRITLPLSYKDEPQEYGTITGLYNLGGELYVHQTKQFYREYFNTRGLVQGENITTITIGNPTIMTQKLSGITSLGLKQRFGSFKGYTESGDECVYWINTESKDIIRFSVNSGVDIISIQSFIQKFCINNMTIIDALDNSVNDSGFCGAFYKPQQYVLFTFRCFNKPTITESGYQGTWNSGVNYSAFQSVSYTSTINADNYEQNGMNLYLCLIPNTNFPPSSNPTYWQVIPKSNNTYYNWFTLLYDLKFKRFRTFLTTKPYIYISSGDYLVTPDSNQYLNNYTNLYALFVGNGYSTFYGGQTENGYVALPFNDNKIVEKRWQSVRLTSNRAVDIELYNDDYHTTINASELKFRHDAYDSAIFYDDQTGNKLTSRRVIRSKYLIVKFKFANVLTKISNFTLKYLFNPRLPNK